MRLIRLRRWFWSVLCWAVTFTRTGRLDGYRRHWADDVHVRIEVAGDAS